MDWSFCTPYKGGYGKIKYFPIQIQIDESLKEILKSPEPELDIFYELESKDQIPMEMLSPDNEIINFGEVLLYEDELGDLGTAKSYVRYRVMKDCWFVLLRSYVRLDKVAVRILDTRIFHKFGENCILRDFMWKQDTWDNLTTKGFNFGSDWLLSPF